MGTTSIGEFGSINRIAKRSGLSRRFIGNAVREGKIPGYRPGLRTVYVRLDDVLALLERQRVPIQHDQDREAGHSPSRKNEATA